jgi:SagB-type dehydrogenase family enzyme
MMERERSQTGGIRYRRSRGLVAYWSAAGFAYFDCATGTRRTAPASVIPLLDALDHWQTPASFQEVHPEVGSEVEVAELLQRMVDMGLAEKEGADHENWLWQDWMPEAAFFHFGTRDADYPVDLLDHELPLVEKAKTYPQPPPTKSMSGPRTPLPASRSLGHLEETLLDRRTWRQIDPRPIDVDQLATILSLTWGVHRRGRVAGQGEVVFKTSPSGGARHPIEAYAIVNAVEGVSSGVYHYDSASHDLVGLGPEVSRERLVALLGNQFYFSNCAVAVVMTACFERTMWRYPFTRAYRTVLIEAGHLAQTFALVSTALSLAPFQTIAFKDTELESVIGVDGVTESAIYVVGVGHRGPDALDHPGRIHPRES